MHPIRKKLKLNGYDNSYSGMYFLTCNVKNGFHYFGKVLEGEMILNTYGVIAQT